MSETLSIEVVLLVVALAAFLAFLYLWATDEGEKPDL